MPRHCFDCTGTHKRKMKVLIAPRTPTRRITRRGRDYTTRGANLAVLTAAFMEVGMEVTMETVDSMEAAASMVTISTVVVSMAAVVSMAGNMASRGTSRMTTKGPKSDHTRTNPGTKEATAVAATVTTKVAVVVRIVTEAAAAATKKAPTATATRPTECHFSRVKNGGTTRTLHPAGTIIKIDITMITASMTHTVIIRGIA